MAGIDIVTIDGPSGVGKSTISRLLARRLGYAYLDTGAMYRAVAHRCQECGVDPEDTEQLQKVLADIRLELLPSVSGEEDTRVVLNGRELGQSLRSPEMGMLASRISAQALVRAKLTGLQQRIGATGRIVAEGRDTGTVVFPQARWKFYLDARPEVRTARRAAQLRAQGKPVDEALLLEQITRRDRDDRERPIAPLKAAEDAVLLDSSDRSIAEILDLLCAHIAAAGGECR